jgi:tetratricopeptide (TPR) repeat protein
MGFSLRNVLQAFQLVESQNSTTRNSTTRTTRSSKQSMPNGSLGHQNRQAIVQQTIQPNQRGRVRYWGSDWFARCHQDIFISPGEIVDIVGVENITLLVEPAFLLSCSNLGLTKVKQAWEQRGWATTAIRPEAGCIKLLMAASQDLTEEAAIETWKRFIQGKPVYITKFKACCELLGLNWQEIVGYGHTRPAQLPQPVLAEPSQPEVETPENTPEAAEPDLNQSPFVGRSNAIMDLARLTRSGATAILILGEGGIGKTTLAQQYFAQQGFDLVLEGWMAKQTQNITSAEGMVQDWLRRYFGEEPAREFQAALKQLKRRLQERPSDHSPKIGVLIDNLEPALDRDGQIIGPHRDYAALLEMLSDRSVHSLTLITSREPLRENNINAQPYILPGLSTTAWQQFFDSQQIDAHSPALAQIHQAYSGNAKAMTILSSTISLDYAGNLENFWQEHQANLLQQTDLEELVASQFERLQRIYPEAYRLLLRLGCYRYQSISAVPAEALHCLLWDVPERQRHSAIRFLEDSFLVEVKSERGNDKYYLHPLIQAKAIALLKASPDWRSTNQRAAEFWTARVKTIETIEDALTAYQAYYHYFYIGDYEAAAGVLLHERDSQWSKQEPLGVSFYRFGLLRRMISAINRLLDRIPPGPVLGKLFNILGDLYWLNGNIHRSIACNEKAKDIGIKFELRSLEISSLFDIGLCKIQLWELTDALDLFQAVIQLAEETKPNRYTVSTWFCLAYLYSCLGQKQEAANLAKKVSEEYAQLSSDAWSRGYSLLFLGLTMKNLGNDREAERLYRLAKDYAEQSHYTQVKASALNGLATIDRDRLNFREAIANHLAAQRLLERIEARGELAEVYYQLGLTYLKMNELAEGKASLQQAIDLFQRMGAPKQVERVKQTLETS